MGRHSRPNLGYSLEGFGGSSSSSTKDDCPVQTQPASVTQTDPFEESTEIGEPLILESLVEDAYKETVLEGLTDLDSSTSSNPFEGSFAMAPVRAPKFLFRLCDLEGSDGNCNVCQGGDGDSSSLEGSVDSGSTSLSSDEPTTERQKFISSLFESGVEDVHTHQVRPAFSQNFTFTAEEGQGDQEQEDGEGLP